MASGPIDTAYDFRRDATTADPDQSSPTLRRYHQLLWSKPLPDGRVFTLDTTTPWAYLYHLSEAGEFFLSSDSITHSYATWRSTADLIAKVDPRDVEEFRTLGYTIGGMLIFPSNKVDGRHTINMARGVHPDIRDRFDLTLECIRRFYLADEDTPLGEVLSRYRDFFELFGDFRGYVEFFLLQDLTDDGGSAVRFHLPFTRFGQDPLPRTPEEYLAYRDASMHFIRRRNVRIARNGLSWGPET
ncbi:DUF6994 family protein [Pseudactinotalea terrae]|uniref:DUF6994 family protein n=1 Tax=Pseudactinotalea terrae TaxID=1743262 RepID=UPI0012E2DB50|nr:hypothetical protein [Pseudactinotalea terrae]